MDAAEIQIARKEIGQIARQLLDGRLSFIEGSRLILRLGRQADLPDRDPDLTRFVAIDSETDSLPVEKGPRLVGDRRARAVTARD
jgi:hypothetical protein